MSSPNSSSTGLALDVGEKRVGIARANLTVRMAHPLTTLENPSSFVEDVVGLVRREDAAWIVLGLPRGLQGQETAQTAFVRAFAEQLQQALRDAGLPDTLHWTDEALTSVRAESELQGRKKSVRGGNIAKGEVDALAATYILEDFLSEHGDGDDGRV
jgi:putative Holliday junction resolvase